MEGVRWEIGVSDIEIRSLTFSLEGNLHDNGQIFLNGICHTIEVGGLVEAMKIIALK